MRRGIVHNAGLSDLVTFPMHERQRAMDPRALAIQPQREAGIRRYTSVLQEADKLLSEEGLTGFSIPVLAERLDYTRRSIYKFFPTPYAILNALTQQYLQELEKALRGITGEVIKSPWAEAVTRANREAATFHNAHPVARLLILGGAVTDESFRVTEFAIQQLGAFLREILRLRGLSVPEDPDVASIAVDIGTAVFRVSNLYYGHITDRYAEESAHAMVAYLRKYVEPASAG